MSPAQFAVLVTPAQRNHPIPGADRQRLVGRRIVSTLTTTYSCWLQFRPDPYLATTDNGYILGFIVFSDRVNSLKLPFFPTPVWVKNHPHVKPLPVRAQISKRLSNNVRFVVGLEG